MKKESPATTRVKPITKDGQSWKRSEGIAWLGELTQGVEDDTRFEDSDIDHLGAWGVVSVVPASVSGSVLGGVPLDETNAEVLDKEGQEETSHQDGSRSGLIVKLTQAFITEHENGMGEELVGLLATLQACTEGGTNMNEGRRDDDASTKLPENGEDGIGWRHERGDENRGKHACLGQQSPIMRVRYGIIPRELVTRITKRRPTRSLML